MNFIPHLTLLEPKGLIALQERDLMLTATYLMLLIVIPVFILTALIAWRYRSSNTRAKYTPNWEHNKLEEFIWWTIPCVIVIVLANMTWKSSQSLDPYRAIPSVTKSLAVQVVALNWKWLFIYPEQHIATVNYLLIPIDTPIHFQITADAPMNSFWIPDLAGQIYAMPGMMTQLHLIASETGIYPGVSANFSGAGFAGMKFETHVVSVADFSLWVQTISQTPAALSQVTYRPLAAPSMDNKAQYFRLSDSSLFSDIIASYMVPEKNRMDMTHK